MRKKGPRGGKTILFTFAVALALAAMPLPDWARPFRPEWVALVLAYWCIALPTRVNVGAGWLAGLTVDVLEGTLLGQHALAYAVFAYACVRVHRQLRVYPLWQQGLAMCVLVALELLLVFWIDGIIGRAPGTFLFWAPALTSALIWPWVFVVLRDLRRRFSVS